MRKLKVAHIINGIGLGGVTTTLYHLLSVLQKDNYEFLVCGLNQHEDHQDERNHQIERFRELNIHPFLLNEKDKKVHVIADLCKWLIQHNVDILHTHSYKPNYYGRMAGILCKNPKMNIVTHYHNAYDDKWERDDSLIYDQLLSSFTDRFIACSSWVRQHISKRVGLPLEKITTIHNGVDATRFLVNQDRNTIKEELGLQPTSPVVGTVGRLSEQKGQDEFLKAAKVILQTVPEAKFLIIGSGREKDIQALRHLTRKLDIEPSVKFLGHCVDMPKMYNGLDLLLAPSRWEGFGLILVEGMAAGTPIVATDVGAIPDVVVPGETALLVPPSSPQALAEKAVFLLTHRDQAEEMGRKGMDRAKGFSWERAGTQLDMLYTNMVCQLAS